MAYVPLKATVTTGCDHLPHCQRGNMYIVLEHIGGMQGLGTYRSGKMRFVSGILQRIQCGRHHPNQMNKNGT